MAAIMQTYLFQSASQMAGKHVGMIVSSHSSSISGVVNDAKRLLPDVTWMGDALWINASNHSNRASLIENWLKTLTFAEENGTTGIRSLSTDPSPIREESIFSLNGQKVSHPSKGIYIKNGKKVIL